MYIAETRALKKAHDKSVYLSVGAEVLGLAAVVLLSSSTSPSTSTSSKSTSVSNGISSSRADSSWADLWTRQKSVLSNCLTYKKALLTYSVHVCVFSMCMSITCTLPHVKKNAL